MKPVIKLIRPKHWIKNGLIFAPLIFGMRLFDWASLLTVFAGALLYSFLSSAIYIFNDIQDVEHDRQHSVKQMRPLPSGQVSIPFAWTLFAILTIVSLTGILLLSGTVVPFLIAAVYLVSNIGYSISWKHIPLLDIVILVYGFVARAYFGAVLIDMEISHWLYLTILSFSFYMGLGKRKNELVKYGDSAGSVRKVLQYYTVNFLDKNMYMCMALTIIFYSLWTIDPITIMRIQSDMLLWTIPMVIVICMKYSLTVESGSSGDPVDVLTKDKVLMILVLLYMLCMGAIIYARNIMHLIGLKVYIMKQNAKRPTTVVIYSESATCALFLCYYTNFYTSVSNTKTYTF